MGAALLLVGFTIFDLVGRTVNDFVAHTGLISRRRARVRRGPRPISAHVRSHDATPGRDRARRLARAWPRCCIWPSARRAISRTSRSTARPARALLARRAALPRRGRPLSVQVPAGVRDGDGAVRARRARNAAKVAWFALSFGLLVGVRAVVGSRAAGAPASGRTHADRGSRSWSWPSSRRRADARPDEHPARRAARRPRCSRARLGARAASPARSSGVAAFVKPYAIVAAALACRDRRRRRPRGGDRRRSRPDSCCRRLVYGWTGNLDLLAAWFRTVTETTAPNLLVADNISLAAMWAKWIGAGPLAAALAS